MDYFLPLLACLTIGLLGHLWRRKSPGAGTVVILLAGVGALGLLAWQIYRFTGAGRPRAVSRPSAALAYVLGNEVLRELPSLQGTIALILPPETRNNAATLDTLFNAFARVVAPIATLQVADAPLDARSKDVEQGRIPREKFERALNHVPNALAYVSFVGLPLDASQLSLLQTATPPPLFVYDPSHGTNGFELLRTGKIRRLIVPRPDPEMPSRGPVTGPPDELFRRFFLLFDPQSVPPANSNPPPR